MVDMGDEDRGVSNLPLSNGEMRKGGGHWLKAVHF